MSILSVNIGGVYVRWGIFDKDYNTLDKGRFKSNIFEGKPKEVIKNISIQIEKILEEHYDVVGISIQFHGIITEDGVLIDPPRTLKHYKWLNIREEFEKHIPKKSIKVFSNSEAVIENEILLGKLKGVEMGMLVNISSSIEGGITYKGEVLKGPMGVTGQFGKQIIDGGQWEVTTGSWALLSKLILMTDDQNITTSCIPKAVHENEMLEKEYDEWFYNLALGIYNLIVSVNPQKIVISGGITSSRYFSIEPLVRHLYKLAIDDLMERIVIEVSDFKETGGIIGGAILYKK